MICGVCCIIPAFNAAGTLLAVVDGLRRSVPDAHVIVVDDGSGDNTLSVGRECADEVIRFDENRGKGSALRAGFHAALASGLELVLTIDADMQHDPLCAPVLLAATSDADLVIGARGRNGGMPLRRRLTNAVSSAAISRAAGTRIPDAQSGFRAIRRCVIEHVRAEGDRYEFESDFLIRAGRAGFRITSVPIPTIYRGSSHFREFSDAVRVVRTIWRHHREAAD